MTTSVAWLSTCTDSVPNRDRHQSGPPETSWSRYFRLYGSFVRASLIREMMFRGNFWVRFCTHVVWLTLMLGFFEVVFLHTERIGDWDKNRYLFFLGTFLTLNALVNSLFIGNFTHFSEMIRSGNLDFAMLKPIDEQFLLSCQRVDWALLPQVLFSLGLSAAASLRCGVSVDPSRILVYVALLAAGLAVLYSLLLALAACSVWTVRHQELYEIWFYAIQFASYPDEIYKGNAVGICLSVVLTYLIPVLVAVNVPARYGAMLLSSWDPVGYLFLAAAVALVGSRSFFRFALKSYCSASS